MGIDKLFVLSCNHILYLLDVLHSNQVAWVRHTGMAILLFIEQREFSLLVWHEDHLIIDDRFCRWYAVNDRHKVNRHRSVVDLNVGVRTDDSREVNTVNIYKTIDLAAFVAHADTLIIDLEVVHRDGFVDEVHREIAVNIFPGCYSIKIRGINTAVLQLVFALTDLHKEIAPFLAVKREKTTLFVLLCDNQIGLSIGIVATCEVTEVAFAQELVVVVGLIVELLSDEHILLVNGIAFAKCLGKGCQQIGKLIVVINVGRILLDGVLYLQDGRVFACLGIENANAIHILDREVDVLKYLLALTSSTESLDRGEHTQEDSRKCYKYIPYHFSSSPFSSGLVYSSSTSPSLVMML